MPASESLQLWVEEGIPELAIPAQSWVFVWLDQQRFTVVQSRSPDPAAVRRILYGLSDGSVLPRETDVPSSRPSLALVK